MAERLRIGYSRLFEVRVLHHFWLDEGTTPVDAIADEATRTTRLLTYDVRRLLAVRPAAATATMITGLRGVFRSTGLGFVVAVPDDAIVPLDAVFEFFLVPTAPDYAGYTALNLRPQHVVDVRQPATPPALTATLRRYKTGVPVLSNLTGASRGPDGAQRLFLSREYANDAGQRVEDLIRSGDDLHQLTGDQPAAPFQVLGATSAHPVYVHQGDVPAITPPAGSTGAPARGIELRSDTPTAVAAVIRLTPRRPGAAADAFSFVTDQGRPHTKVFEVHLRNRWTTRRYRDKRDGSITATEAGPLPLTHFGNNGSRRRPSAGAVGIERTGSPPKITRLVSDIYV